jgi:hypothetical protein
MQKPDSRKLRLTRETIRRLAAADLSAACSDTALCGPTRTETEADTTGARR